MMEINEALKLHPGTDLLRNEINERVKMRDDMLGWLYKSVMQSEIDKLILRFNETECLMDPVEKSNRRIEVKNRIYSYLGDKYNMVIQQATRKLNCSHSWLAYTGGYHCSMCDEFTGDNTELNTMIAEEIRLSR